ncbi:TPA: hypothetical protein ACH3X1_009162 [Trebouxia sp. C0004]
MKLIIGVGLKSWGVRSQTATTDFMQQLQQDRPDTPLWLDPEDAANAAAADQVPTENFALTPRWVGCSWTWRGKAGYWDPNITGNVAQQVIGHTHAIPNGNRAMAKQTNIASHQGA